MLPADDPNFRPAGSEPLYDFGANVFQAVRVDLVLDALVTTGALLLAAILRPRATACRASSDLADQNPLLAGFRSAGADADAARRVAGVVVRRRSELGQHRARAIGRRRSADRRCGNTRAARLAAATLWRALRIARGDSLSAHRRWFARWLHRRLARHLRLVRGRARLAAERCACASRTSATVPCCSISIRPAAVLATSSAWPRL